MSVEGLTSYLRGKALRAAYGSHVEDWMRARRREEGVSIEEVVTALGTLKGR